MKNYSASIFFGEDHDHAAHIRFSFGDSNFGDSQMPEDINIEISHVVWEGPDAEEQFGHLNLEELLEDNPDNWVSLDTDYSI